ncbi:P-loop containing nucleoside triphosphate hydrolase protein [Polychytrium aggregatum]|uniref:P-loop containing nucleoside triphosphate hydrolase protein n=1 Tax=Polychytrium aggregatum TaxID=110093 RepID=UPI0022FEE088|nr:P-loop containing nucleoside triphosphate hydrolase protein [Polychytrium aggregatum]KAI9203411.1 P-loop containing nucleoside triphosphate hydrolase protein [Polychytrium aggregatum]
MPLKCRLRHRNSPERLPAIALASSISRRVFSFDQIYEANASNEDVFRSTARPLIEKWLDGFNVALVCVGNSGSGKTFSLVGGDKGGGLIQQCVAWVAGQQADLERSGRQILLTVQFFELYGELVKDLIDPSRDNLGVEEDVNRGFVVRGLSHRSISNAAEMGELCFQAYQNRSGEMSDQISERAIVFAIVSAHNSQAAEAKGECFAAEVTHFTFVDLCGLEHLLEEPTKSVMRSGVFASRTIMSLWKAMKHCSITASPTFDCRQAVSTQLMSEILGGNTFVAYLAHLNPTDPVLQSMAILSTSEMIHRIVNYPIKMDNCALNLLRRYRIRLREADELTSSEIHLLQRPEESANSEDMSRRVLQSTRLLTSLQDDYEKLKARLAEYNERIEKLSAAKHSLEEKVTVLEEEKLKTEATLIDSQIENSKITMKLSTTSGEVDTKVTALTSELQSEQAKLRTAREENVTLKRNLSLLESQAEETRHQLEVLRGLQISTQGDNKKKCSQMDELRVEILNLVNAKNALLKEKEEKLAEIARLAKHNEYLQKKLETLELRGFEASSELKKIKLDLEKSRSEESGSRIELERRLIALERESNDRERKMLEQRQQYEVEIAALKESCGVQSQAHEEARKVLAAEVQQLNAKRESLNEEISRNETLIKKLSKSEEEWRKRHTDLEKKLNAQRAEYRRSVEELISRLTNEAGSQEISGRPHKTLQAMVERMFKEIIGTYMQNEKYLLQQLQELRAKKPEASKAKPRHQADEEAGTERAPKTTDRPEHEIASRAGNSEKSAKAHKDGSSEELARLKKELKEFMLNSQRELENERARLLVRCTVAEEQVSRLSEALESCQRQLMHLP